MIITYTAFDGKTFNDKKECEDHEYKLKLLGLAYAEFSKFLDKISEDYNDNLWICEEKLEINNIINTIAKEHGFEIKYIN